MRERPILFSGPMVKAILEGRKTQTRRVMKPQPELRMDGEIINQGGPGEIQYGPGWELIFPYGHKKYGDLYGAWNCPYGQPGTVLYVKETCWILGHWRKNGLTKTGRQKWRFITSPSHRVVFDPDDNRVAKKNTPRETEAFWKRPSIFMPRWACRIFGEITNIRVERVDEISEEDAKAEGIRRTCPRYENGLEVFHVGEWPQEEWSVSARGMFRLLWNSINAKKYPWESNPWIWVVEFRRVI